MENQINKIHCMDVRKGLKQLPDKSIDMVMTSPPYWALRDYNIEPSIWDGKKDCDHEFNHMKFKAENALYNDSGSLSRYFDLDKWFEERIKKLPKEIKKTFPFLFVAKPSSSEKNKELVSDYVSKHPSGVLWNEEEKGGFVDTLNQCTHPTVKPIKLFSYLITMGSRENDLVLDPYIGSGTFGISARLTTRNFIGFEKEKEYFEIAEARVKKYMQQTKILDF